MESDNKHEFEGFPVFQMVKNLPAMWETWVSSLGLRRSLGKGNDYPLQYSFLENPWTEKPGRLQSMGSQRIGHDWVTNTFTFTLRRDKNRLKTWSILGGAAGDMEVRGQQRYLFLPVTVVGDLVLVKMLWCLPLLCVKCPTPSFKSEIRN